MNDLASSDFTGQYEGNSLFLVLCTTKEEGKKGGRKGAGVILNACMCNLFVKYVKQGCQAEPIF